MGFYLWLKWKLILALGWYPGPETSLGPGLWTERPHPGHTRELLAVGGGRSLPFTFPDSHQLLRSESLLFPLVSVLFLDLD